MQTVTLENLNDPAVRKAIKRLPPKCKDIFVDRHINKLPMHKLVSKYRINRATIEDRCNEAIDLLKQRFYIEDEEKSIVPVEPIKARLLLDLPKYPRLEKYLKFNVSKTRSMFSRLTLPIEKFQEMMASQASIVVVDWPIEFFREVSNIFELPTMVAIAPVDDWFSIEQYYAAGASSVIPVPLDYPIVCAQIKRLLERIEYQKLKNAGEDDVTIACNMFDIEINPFTRSVKHKGKVVKINRMEFEVLLLLASRPNTIIPRNEIFSRVWGTRSVKYETKTIEQYMCRLRRAFDGQLPIVTVRGYGYGLLDEASRDRMRVE